MSQYALMFVSVVAYGFWNFFQKLAVSKMHAVYVLIVNYCVAALLIPFYYYIATKKISEPFSMAGAGWAAASFICATIGALTFLLSMKTGEVSTLSVLSSTSPIITCALAIFFLNESLTLNKIIGLVLVIGGIVIIGR